MRFGGVPNPYISVIVTAHDRRKYLPDALRSLERQTLNKDEFEVIVVKNFEDPTADEIIRRNGWKDVVTDVKPLGGKIAIGLEESKGEVVTFLEDDDMYVPERLQVVGRKFREVRDLVYFHNAQLMVDEKGRTISFMFGSPILKTDLVINRNVKNIWCSIDYIRALTGADANNSSIAIRRELLQPRDIELLKTLLITDIYFYAKAFTSDGLLYLSASKLTVYRAHMGTPSGHLVPWTALRYLQEGRLTVLKEELRITRLLRAISIMNSAPVAYELATKNCSPYNDYWQHYIYGRYDWITYSQNPLLIGRASLHDLLKAAIILAYLNKKHHDFAIRLSEALMGIRSNKGDNKGRNVHEMAAQNWFVIVLSAMSLATLKYLLQFSPRSVKEKYLNLSLKIELRRGLEKTILKELERSH